jgi:hypothetical protein
MPWHLCKALPNVRQGDLEARREVVAEYTPKRFRAQGDLLDRLT